MQINHSTAIVTGGASGIGRGMALALAEQGARLVVADIDLAGAQQVAEEINGSSGDKAIAVHLDARDAESWKQVADRAEEAFGKIHILCSNAGVAAGRGNVEDRTLEDLDWVWSVNARGMFIGVKEVLPRIRRHGEGGHIVITSSMMGLFASPGTSLYVMSKYAAAGLGEVLFLELKNTNIGVSILCPGVVNTSLLSNVQKNMPSQRGNDRNVETVAFLEAGADAVDVGNQVVKGISNNDFYIFSHPEYKPLVEERFDLVLSAFCDRATPDKQDDLSYYSVTYKS
ncbi:SDR family oxidoreductase [Sphingobium sp. V4]|uniref:SDR family oxidoreductase n=1 Tax=Sphingobium sp. V4 TaxID=3038927 RepID=UPI002557FD9C|nr:SDR family oxidoreductase [Sphingobium sp. V4]WIW89492.1 SDR family oxidoreductase [Sphingobium sp. V4]